MAATYHVVVSSLNYYSSVVIDRRAQHAVHYCTGPCQLLTHGLDCTAAHRSACAELLDATVSALPAAAARPSAALRLFGKCSALGNSGFPIGGAEAMMDDCYQALQGVSRARKGLASQAFSGSLKDITGEAINLASGKVKEFSHEKDRVFSSHTILRKCRKARPDSLLRRSADLDVLLGRFSVGNEENCPPFGLPPPEDPLGPEPSISMATAVSHLNASAEEDLVARILEKAKAEGGAQGQDMRACLEILLRCSEDLRRCTDIIRQCCISRKSTSDAGDYSGSEIAYRSALASLSGFLKKLPLGFGAEQAQPWQHEQGDLAELLRTLQWLQHSSPSSIFGDDLPPRYEDVVQSPPELSALLPQPPSPSQPEAPGKAEPTPNVLTPLSPAASPPSHSPQRGKVTASIQLNHPDSLSFVSSMALAIKKTSAIVTTPEEPLYIIEDDDGGEAGGEGDRTFNKALGVVLRGNALKLGDGNCLSSQVGDGMYIPTESVNLEPRPSEDHVQRGTSRDDSDEIDKLLTDLEWLSRSIAKEPPTKIRGLEHRNGSQHTVAPHQHPTRGPPAPPPRVRQDPDDGSGEDGDNVLLQRILDSIESLAQELVENGTGRAGSLSKEREVMRILQDTLSTPEQSEAQDDSISDHVPGTAIPDPAPPANSTSSLLIQPIPEDVRIQNKLEESGVPPPTPAPGSTPASHYPRPTSPTSVPDTNSPPPRAPSPAPAEKRVAPAPVNIPRFYFPEGFSLNGSADLNQTVAKIEMTFVGLQEQKADIHDMGKIAKACGCPLYWKAVLFHGAGGDRTGTVSARLFIATWRKLLHSCYDDSTKFVHLLAKPGCKYLEQEDFIPLLQDIVDTHPGLTFLKDAPEFHSRYITTVIQRIFYTVNRSWTGRITMTELRRSNFLQTLALLEEEDDINLITDYFSYEHFYVIYCKFWELDTDHDLFIDQKDLGRYNGHASSNRIIERIVSGAVMKGGSMQRHGRMSYAEFVWYLISEEDKKTLTSIEYWFRCMDLDGDGILSMYELQFFYAEQCEHMENMGVEPLPFNDLLCQMLDLVKPEHQGKITLSDLKRCRMAHIFYDTFFNLDKYLDHEQRDPFTVQKDFDSDIPEPSDWEKFAAEEYDVLVAEDTASDHPAEGSFEDDCESEECTNTPVKGSKADMTEEIVLSNLSG